MVLSRKRAGPCAMPPFFIAGLLYLFCLRHVDNPGAYGIPQETGPFKGGDAR
jgi:hypothetical protein